jgi:hypothetical protein
VSGEVDRDERTEPGLDIGEKKVEPVEAARARGRGRRGRGRRRQAARRRRRDIAPGEAAEPTAVEFQRQC